MEAATTPPSQPLHPNPGATDAIHSAAHQSLEAIEPTKDGATANRSDTTVAASTTVQTVPRDADAIPKADTLLEDSDSEIEDVTNQYTSRRKDRRHPRLSRWKMSAPTKRRTLSLKRRRPITARIHHLHTQRSAKEKRAAATIAPTAIYPTAHPPPPIPTLKTLRNSCLPRRKNGS